MRALARFVMSGRLPAIALAAASLLLSLPVPPLSSPLAYVSGGIVALASLSQSLLESLGVLVGAAVLTALVASLIYTTALPVVGAAVILWVPVLCGARILKASNDLPVTLLALTLLAVMLVVVFHLSLGDTVAWWENHLSPVLKPVLEQQGMDSSVVAQIAPWMTGLLATALLVGIVLSLLLGRWWQALVFSRGSFGEEFRRLQFGRVMAGVTLLIWAATTIPDPPWRSGFRDIGIVLVVPFVLAGLAVLHGLVHSLRLHKGWLVVVYVMIIVASPAVELLLALLGLADSWLNIRQRVSSKGAS
jgi:hypothetical protein